jgi:hypothetical protein
MKRAVLLAVISLVISFPAHAQEYEQGTALLCDNQTQVKRYVELFKGEEQAAVDAVNEEAQDPTACAFQTVTFVRGPEVETARNKGGAFQIVRILVVGVETASGFRAVRPSAFFSAFAILEYDV